MKKHFVLLFDAGHRWTTALLFAAAALLITVSILVGITDNLPMIMMLFAGIIFLFFTVLHPWRDTYHFAMFTVVCAIPLPFIWFWPEYLGEDWAMTLGGICFAGVFTGFIGILSRANYRKKKNSRTIPEQ